MLKATKEIDDNLYIVTNILHSLGYFVLSDKWKDKIRNLVNAMENELYEGFNDNNLNILERKLYITNIYEKTKEKENANI